MKLRGLSCLLWASGILSLVKLEVFKNGVLKKSTERGKIVFGLAIFFNLKLDCDQKNKLFWTNCRFYDSVLGSI